MKTIKGSRLLVLCLLIGSSVLGQPAENPQTFCNPLNLDYRFMIDAVDAREAADAVILLFQDDYYLFASRSGGYWTSPDLRNWTLIVPTGIDIETYAPAVLAMRDSLFYIPSNNGQIYKTGDPKSGVWQRGPNINNYGDPDFFLDDDDRLYMFYGLSNTAPIRGVELDPRTFREIGSPVDLIFAQASIHGWERRGDDNLLDEQPWIEGAWMVKENNRYYLHYAGPGTEFKTYADGIYVADSPLGPYQYATYSPFSFKPTGFICGAGHGSTFMDKHGQYWHIGTMSISVKHMFERRLGLSPVAYDADGHIRCNTTWGDYPQYLPGTRDDLIDNSFAGMMLLSHKKYVQASSSVEGHGAGNAVDEDARTYWSAQTGDPDEWLMIDLGKACTVEAVQVNFAEHRTNPDLVRGRDKMLYQQYTIEKSMDGMHWEMLIDKSGNLRDVPHDYVELAHPATARYIKMTNVFTPGGGNFAIRGLRIFGNSEHAVFIPVPDFTVDRDPGDGRDAVIRWAPVENADGYLICYGIAPDKLYNHYMVYDADHVSIHSLNHGVEYFFEVTAFDSGTDYYLPAGEFRSSRSGNWNDVDTWSWHNGLEWTQPAPNAPTYLDAAITILDGHTITVTEDVAVDQLTLAAGGILVIEEGVTFSVRDGIGTDCSVEGTLRNHGVIAVEDQATLSLVQTGRYEHKQDGGTIPNAVWRPSSTCVIDGVKESAPANGNQDFYNLLWNCPDQTRNLSMRWNGNTIGGDITVQSTGSGRWQLCAPSPDSSAMLTLNGDILQSGGQFSSNGTGNGNTAIVIRQNGNVEVTGGNFSVSRGSQGGSGTTAWYLHGNVSLADAATQNSNPGGARFVFTGDGAPQTLTLSGVTYGGGGFPVEVDSGAILDIGSSTLEGNGSFSLKAGATLLTAHENGVDASIAVTGTRTFDKAAGFGFNGTTAQVTGSLMPDTVRNLLIDNPQGVTLSHSVTVDGTLELRNGTLSLGGNALAYGADASLAYSGATAQTTSDVEFPAVSGPKNLIVSNRRGVTLHASRTIGHLDLSSRLNLGTNTLTADAASEGDLTAYAVTTDGGLLRLTSVGSSPKIFPVGTTSYAPVRITNHGIVDAVSVGAVRDNEDAPYGGRVRVKWNIEEETPGGGDYTLQFGWTTPVENTEFRNDRARNARIFNLSDTTEAGTGEYTAQFLVSPFTIARSGIQTLGPFAVGLFGEVTGVAGSPESMPKAFMLDQNYPNPFNPETRIRFRIPERSFVSIRIYNLLGEQVFELAGKEFSPGLHSLTFDASHLSSGIYFYTIRVNDSEFVKTRKMLYAR